MIDHEALAYEALADVLVHGDPADDVAIVVHA